MSSLHNVAVLVAVVLIGSIGASLPQQTVASVAPPDPEKQFKELTKDMQEAVLDAATPPADLERIQVILDAYVDGVVAAFSGAHIP